MTTPVTGQAVSLHLAGVPAAQIATTLGLTVEQVQAAVIGATRADVTPELGTELARVDALWKANYARAVGGDADAQVIAIRLSSYRQELLSRAGIQEARDTPQASVRDAWQIMANGAVEAAETLRAIVRNGRSEGVRAHAALALLTRVGIGDRSDSSTARYQTVDDDGMTMSPGEIVRNRLRALTARQAQLDATIDAEPFPDIPD